MDTHFKQSIDQLITAHPVVIFMKGTKEVPQCGFSAKVAQIFNALGVPFHDVNILANESMRQGMKDYSNWPTFPQIYVKGQFLGGCDIVSEMYDKGELQALVKP